MENFDSLGKALAELTAKYACVTKDESPTATSDDAPDMPSAPDNVPACSSDMNRSTVITLNVGGRRFQTTVHTLCAESGFFHDEFSGVAAWTPEDDGSYFIDADPDFFEHLLRFMRRPNTFPLFYDNVKGFEYGLYVHLEAEAQYFKIDALHTWIKDKEYLEAVTVKVAAPTTQNIVLVLSKTYNGNVNEGWQVVPRVRKVYLCPRQILVHRGDPSKCGRACREAQGDDDVRYQEVPYTDMVTVKKTVEFDDEVCKVDEGSDEDTDDDGDEKA
jgi:hypothetical protein